MPFLKPQSHLTSSYSHLWAQTTWENLFLQTLADSLPAWAQPGSSEGNCSKGKQLQSSNLQRGQALTTFIRGARLLQCLLFLSITTLHPHTMNTTSRAAIQRMWSGTGGLGTGDFASKNEPKFAIMGRLVYESFIITALLFLYMPASPQGSTAR